jgi:hypothetical protein
MTPFPDCFRPLKQPEWYSWCCDLYKTAVESPSSVQP